MPDAGIGYAGDGIDFDGVVLRQGPPAAVADVFHVDALVVGGRVAVIDPEKGADLHLAAGRVDLHHPVGGQQDRFTGPQEAFDVIAGVGERARFGGGRIGPCLLADHHGGAPQAVAGGVHTVVGQQQQRTGALDRLLGVPDAGCEGVLGADQHGHHFRRAGLAAGGFGEVQAPVEGLALQLGHIGDPCDGDEGKVAQVGPDHQRLGVVVADHPDAHAARELGQIGFELGAEVIVLDVVNRPFDPVGIPDGHTAAAGAEVEMIIRPVEDIRNTIRCRDHAEKSTHANTSFPATRPGRRWFFSVGARLKIVGIAKSPTFGLGLVSKPPDSGLPYLPPTMTILKS